MFPSEIQPRLPSTPPNISAVVFRPDVSLASPTRNEQHRSDGERGVGSHDQEERMIPADEIEDAAVERVAKGTAKRHAPQEQRRENASVLTWNRLDKYRSVTCSEYMS